MRQSKFPLEPWHSFLNEVDAMADGPLRMDCIGGFVVTQLYGLDRPTADIDVIELAPPDIASVIFSQASKGTPLAGKHRIFIDRVTVAAIPEDYESRLVAMFPDAYRHLRLMAVDPYDLALSKLERDSQKDREDVRFLCRTIPLDLQVLEERYRKEMRWQLGMPTREDLTLKLWIEMIEEDRAPR
jgi:hypothetical protein